MESNEIMTEAAVVGMEQDYLTTIQEMQKNSVRKDEYDKLHNENKRLLEMVVNGETIEQNNLPSIDYNAEGHKLIFGETKHTNLDYVKKALEVRDAALKDNVNINMPFGPKAQYTENDIEQTEYIARKLQEAVDKADGDPSTFNFLLDQMLVDNLPAKARGRVTR